MFVQTYFFKLLYGCGFFTVLNASRDVKCLFLQRFFRLFAYGATFLILVQFLTSLGISDELAGLFMTLTMLGDAVISFVLVLITDQVGRRKILALGAILMIMSGIVFSLSSTYWILVLASVIGVISPRPVSPPSCHSPKLTLCSGNEIGPFRAVEESIIAQLTEKDDRSDIFAWYTMCGTAGAALGTIASGAIVQAASSGGTIAYRLIFLLYSALGVVKLILTLALGPKVELQDLKPDHDQAMELENETLLSDSSSGDSPEEQVSSLAEPSMVEAQRTSILPRRTVFSRLQALLPQISRKSITILLRLILLFALDSFASGLASPSWLTYFFTTFHGIAPGSLGTLFFVTNILATLSNFAALPLARRLGPLKTMTFTHLPSAIFLALVPIPRADKLGTIVSMAFLSLRACTQSMDQAPRQAFLAAVMRPEERTAVLGVVNIAKTIAQAGGIGSSGVLAERRWWLAMLGGAGLMKATYDLLILWTFLGVPDREDGHT